MATQYTVYYIDESALGDPVSEEDCLIMQDAVNEVIAEHGLDDRAHVVVGGPRNQYSYVPSWNEELNAAIAQGFERGYARMQAAADAVVADPTTSDILSGEYETFTVVFNDSEQTFYQPGCQLEFDDWDADGNGIYTAIVAKWAVSSFEQNCSTNSSVVRYARVEVQ